MGQQHTPEEWERIGRQIGQERGQLDMMANDVQPVDRLWVPANVTPDYVRGLYRGYRETVAGEPAKLGI